MRRRVESKRAPKAPVPLPRDAWQGGTFREAAGSLFEVVWNGAAKYTGLCPPQPTMPNPEPARLSIWR